MRVRSFLCTGPVVLALVSAGTACGAAMGGGPGMNAVYREDLGRATPLDLQRHVREIFVRFHYDMEREEHSDYAAVYESRWTGRFPTPEEQAAGIEEIRMRITIRGGAVQMGTGLARVQFVGETLVRFAGEMTFATDAMSDVSRARFKEIARALRTELETGIRVRG